jgi:hypothetical protein
MIWCGKWAMAMVGFGALRAVMDNRIDAIP